MGITLYKLDASAPVRAVQMVIAAIKLTDVEYVVVDLFKKDHLKEEFLKMNPQHSVPTLVDDDFVIWDSHAISTYLVSMYADNDTLYPTDPKKRAIVDQRLHFDSGILFPAMRRAVDPLVFGGDKGYKLEALLKIEQAYGFVESFLSAQWLAGDNMTVADLCCVATISSLNEILTINGKLFPKLVDWLKRLSDLDIYKQGNLPGVLMFGHILKTSLA